MYKRLVPLILLVSFFMAAFSQAPDTDLNISRMEINLWPEYDQASVLVIFRVSFSSIANFPARVSLRIPKSAGDPYSVAMKDLDGLLYDLEYTVIPDGNWNRIEFVTSSQDLQIEFYEPYVQQSDIIRGYDFNWISDYPVDEFIVSIQKPKFAAIMNVEPYAGKGEVNPDDELTYYTVQYGKIGKGALIYLHLSYIKTNDGLSASTVPVNPANPLPGQKTLWETLTSILPTIWQNKSLLITGGLLLGALVLFNLLVAIVPGTNPKRGKPNKANPVKAKQQPVVKEEKEVFCYQCGKRARPGDAYCRTCGSRLVE
jgi:hypothetical protein